MSLENKETIFITGSSSGLGRGAAKLFAIERDAGDPFQSQQINYHYLRVDVNGAKMKVTMRRLELKDNGPTWSEPDRVAIGQ